MKNSARDIDATQFFDVIQAPLGNGKHGSLKTSIFFPYLRLSNRAFFVHDGAVSAFGRCFYRNFRELVEHDLRFNQVTHKPFPPYISFDREKGSGDKGVLTVIVYVCFVLQKYTV